MKILLTQRFLSVFAVIWSLLLFQCQERGYPLHGQLLDDEGAPIVGAEITVDGVEANGKTDSEGWFTVVSPFPYQNEISFTISKSGYESSEFLLPRPDDTISKHGRKGPMLVAPTPLKASPPALLQVTSPQDGALVELDGCCDGVVEVSGLVSGPPRDNLYLDVVFALDVSGSIEKKEIFEQEISAAQTLLGQLNPDTTRVAVVRFASEAEQLQKLTKDFSKVTTVFGDLLEGGPEPYGEDGSATHYAEALREALDTHKKSPIKYRDSTTNKQVTVQPLRVVVFISDGIPTLPAQPGMSQEKADIQASLAAARLLAAQGVLVYGYALDVDSAERELTTLPAIAAITSGRYSEVRDPDDAVFIIPETSLVGMGAVDIENLKTGEKLTVETSPDGFFSGSVSVGPGTQSLRISARDFDGLQATTQDVTVIGEYEIDRTEPLGLADQPVSERGVFTPYGDDLDDNDIWTLLVGAYGQYPDAVESINTEVFVIPGDEGESMTLAGEFVFSEACYKGDFGYLIVDPSDLEASTLAQFEAATSENVLFNTIEGGDECGTHYLEPGEVTFDLTLPAGTSLVFFLVSDGTLAEGQAGLQAVLYTVSSFNLGGYDQVLSYYSEEGRGGNGSRQSILAFEDQPLVNSPPLDYSDVVIHLEGLYPSQPSCGCD